MISLHVLLSLSFPPAVLYYTSIHPNYRFVVVVDSPQQDSRVFSEAAGPKLKSGRISVAVSVQLDLSPFVGDVGAIPRTNKHLLWLMFLFSRSRARSRSQ